MAMKRYNPSEIEPKWQVAWESQRAFAAADLSDKQKFYISCMFPYPSGAGMHIGHAFEHTIVDAVARFQREHGKNVLAPIGWDAFGLPTENYAIKTHQKPADVTAANVANFKTQVKRMGQSIDWSREINTSDPEYYRWTQWVFTKLFERGLAYQKQSAQWWCPVDKTVLANEQVEGGKCWRCGSTVTKKSMKQWFFKITDYADDLLEGLDSLDWPEKIIAAQRNWIGRSQGAEIDFQVQGSSEKLTVFTTRPDTIFGATFLVIAPEHRQARKLLSADAKAVAEAYITAAQQKSDIERMNTNREKTGVPTGSLAVNPATGEAIPIWIADYVLPGYGTGAIMAVPAHDERDFAFAEAFNLPVVEVIDKPSDDIVSPYHGEGVLINSGAFDGTRTEDAREQIAAWLAEQNVGTPTVNYRMRDWLISRQRYWGAPIPIVHCKEHGAVAVPEEQLPVILPEVDDFTPKGDGRSVLANLEEWTHTTCPKCGQPAIRETDTMDGFACSSWYLLRYADPKNHEAAWNPEKVNYWAPLDYYVGGDHAVAHLLYVRFWTRVFYDMGLVNFQEPVKKLVYHGMINAEDGSKMSKSKGNVIDPLDIVNQGYGADTLRTYLLFIGPIDLDAAWDSGGIAGAYRFLNRIWTLVQEYQAYEGKDAGDAAAVTKALHKAIRKVTDDISSLRFNTAIAALMEFVNELYKQKLNGMSGAHWEQAIKQLVQLVAPFAPHLAEELWQQLGGEGLIQAAAWPNWDDQQLAIDTITIVVQVNGKVRATLSVPPQTSEEDIRSQALKDERVVKFTKDSQPKRIVYVPGKLVNIVL